MTNPTSTPVQNRPEARAQATLASIAKPVAEVYSEDGIVFLDRCYGWESAASYASDGMRVRVLTGDAHLTKRQVQQICDERRAAFIDAFGL